LRFDLENLPSDTTLLHRLVREMVVVVDGRDDEIERLQLIIKKLQRARFGRRSERLDADQLALALKDLPLYRQSQIFARHGVDLSRSTLAGWVGGACWWLEALHERLCKNVFASDHLFADDTPIPMLDPGRGNGILFDYHVGRQIRAGSSLPDLRSILSGLGRRLHDQAHSGRAPAIQVVRTSKFVVKATMSARAPALSVPRWCSIPKNRAGTSDAARSASSREIPTSVTAFLTADAKSR
jgi:hypothetical protein